MSSSARVWRSTILVNPIVVSVRFEPGEARDYLVFGHAGSPQPALQPFQVFAAAKRSPLLEARDTRRWIKLLQTG
jgi:hypothetical protein